MKNIKQLRAEVRADVRRPGSYNWVMLRDRDDPSGGWFDSLIEGTFEQCEEEIANQSLHDDFDVQIAQTPR